MGTTMADLRNEVASRLRNSLHGREIDMMETVPPRLPHMLGVTPIGNIHDPNNEKMTLLDPNHHFWDEYEKDVTTEREVTQEIETAVRSLKEDGILQMTHPYGEEADVIYVEVEKMESDERTMNTTCADCGAHLTTQLDLVQTNGYYHISISLDCDECDFSRELRQNLVRQ